MQNFWFNMSQPACMALPKHCRMPLEMHRFPGTFQKFLGSGKVQETIDICSA